MTSHLSPQYTGSWALVVGVDSYQTLAPLTTARRGAEAVAAYLRDQLGFETTTLYDADATRESILRWFGKLKTREDDRVLFYFAGHGVTRPIGRRAQGYLALANSDGYWNSLAMDDILDEAEAVEAKHVLYLLDACFSGLALRGRADEFDAERAAEYLLTRPARYAITAGGDEMVDDDAAGDYSLFTHFLLQGLADRSLASSGVLRAKKLGLYLEETVSAHRRSHALPNHGYLSGSGDGDFIFWWDTSPRLPADLESALLSHVAEVRWGAVAALIQLVNTAEAETVLTARARLQQIAASDPDQRVRTAAQSLFEEEEARREWEGLRGQTQELEAEALLAEQKLEEARRLLQEAESAQRRTDEERARYKSAQEEHQRRLAEAQAARNLAPQAARSPAVEPMPAPIPAAPLEAVPPMTAPGDAAQVAAQNPVIAALRRYPGWVVWGSIGALPVAILAWYIAFGGAGEGWSIAYLLLPLTSLVWGYFGARGAGSKAGALTGGLIGVVFVVATLLIASEQDSSMAEALLASLILGGLGVLAGMFGGTLHRAHLRESSPIPVGGLIFVALVNAAVNTFVLAVGVTENGVPVGVFYALRAVGAAAAGWLRAGDRPADSAGAAKRGGAAGLAVWAVTFATVFVWMLTYYDSVTSALDLWFRPDELPSTLGNLILCIAAGAAAAWVRHAGAPGGAVHKPSAAGTEPVQDAPTGILRAGPMWLWAGIAGLIPVLILAWYVTFGAPSDASMTNLFLLFMPMVNAAWGAVAARLHHAETRRAGARLGARTGAVIWPGFLAGGVSEVMVELVVDGYLTDGLPFLVLAAGAGAIGIGLAALGGSLAIRSTSPAGAGIVPLEWMTLAAAVVNTLAFVISLTTNTDLIAPVMIVMGLLTGGITGYLYAGTRGTPAERVRRGATAGLAVALATLAATFIWYVQHEDSGILYALNNYFLSGNTAGQVAVLVLCIAAGAAAAWLRGRRR